ncbi:cytochrome c oxidase assembly protein [Wenxinia saemankumensis]|uniref:Cytochrome c oxidase assembly protein CtaG n=1 Tax=Wenxinia saemankumensis TaxID=1447782 RepID=A0A1M6GVT3_9RHOB|nr:cytochrome c oxidase assembly protein [Wenxinia saemankumensis]SHJ14048.1 cytochrome c oxidase assembly protein subunit 11 [Wenxinia saemankumensis]
MKTPFDRIRDPNLRTAAMAGSVVVFMGAMAWAAVPFYSWFCAVTGFGGTTQVASEESDRILDRTMLVRFDANVAPDMPWEFRPVQTEMRVRIGESGLAFYEATNTSDVPVAGQASFNVAPYSVGAFFDKVQCFCFTEQVLLPGQTVQMPVSFYVDPDLVDHREAKYVRELTLSYTFYEIDLPENWQEGAEATAAQEQAALSPELTESRPSAIDQN